MSTIYDGLEPAAKDAGERFVTITKSIGTGITNDHELSIWQYSQAISLKRIADTLGELFAYVTRPHIELVEQGVEDLATKRHREWCERMDRLQATDERTAAALETLAGELAHPEWGVAPTIREAARNR